MAVGLIFSTRVLTSGGNGRVSVWGFLSIYGAKSEEMKLVFVGRGGGKLYLGLGPAHHERAFKEKEENQKTPLVGALLWKR